MKNRNASLDILKTNLAFFVIMLHGSFLKEYNELLSYLTVNGIFRVAVPIFFIINGYFFQSILKKDNYKIWLKRSTILYILWMIIYSPFWIKHDLKKTITSVIIGYHHLWYLNSMILSGILLKIFYCRIRLFTLAIILFVIGVSTQYIGNYHIFLNSYNLIDKLTNTTFVHRNFLFLGLPFFIIGFLIKENKWEQKIVSKKLVWFILTSTLLLLFESYINYLKTDYSSNDNLVSLILLSPIIFLFVINQNYKIVINSKKLALISTSTYLIHPWIMTVLKKLFDLNETFLSLSTIILSVSFSLIIIRINKTIKYLL
jgi:surface polysaccharide O-acyltransferase-like enzyme